MKGEKVPLGKAEDRDGVSVAQEKAITELYGIEDQIQKRHWLNVHFRAYQLANDAWKEHIRLNAETRAREVNSPGGAVLDPERDGNV